MSRAALRLAAAAAALLGAGCPSLTYLGPLGDAATLPTPPGFALTPRDVAEIRAVGGPERPTDDVYHDDSWYYVVDGEPFSTGVGAYWTGMLIHGGSGGVLSTRWQGTPSPDPRPRPRGLPGCREEHDEVNEPFTHEPGQP